MSTLAGQSAEQAVAQWLKQTKSWKLIDSNWRTAGSELDLIMQDKKIIHFIEVKYRRSATAGAGYEYVTSLKQQKLIRGVRTWLLENGWKDGYQIDIVSASGEFDDLKLVLYENVINSG